MNVPTLRPEISAAGRQKLERAGCALNRSANNVLNALVDSLEEMEIRQTITLKIRAQAGSPAALGGQEYIIVRKTSTCKTTF